MSARATFELPAGADVKVLEARVREIWKGDFVDVLIQETGRTTLQLGWFFSSEEQNANLRDVVLFLLQHFAGKPLFYIRDNDAFSPDDPDYPRPITVDEMVSERFQPALTNGVQYRYLISNRQI